MSAGFSPFRNAEASANSANFPKFDSVFRTLLQTTDLLAGAGNLFEFALNPNLPNRLFYFQYTIAGTNVHVDVTHEFHFNGSIVAQMRTIDRGTGQSANVPRITTAQNFIASAGICDDMWTHFNLTSSTQVRIPPQTLWVRADKYHCRVNRLVTQGLSNRFMVQINSSNSPQ